MTKQNADQLRLPVSLAGSFGKHAGSEVTAESEKYYMKKRCDADKYRRMTI